MKVQHMLPEDIERTSMDMISRKLYERGIVLPEEHAAVVKRVIHTTADFDFARNLHFTPNAVGLAKAALFRGVAIVTDTNMAKAGISKSALAKLGGQVCCFMADEDVAQTAKEKGTTRAVAAMEQVRMISWSSCRSPPFLTALIMMFSVAIKGSSFITRWRTTLG